MDNLQTENLLLVQLRAVLAEVETAPTAELEACIAAATRRLELRRLGYGQQNDKAVQIAAKQDIEALKDMAAHSSFEDIRDWCVAQLQEIATKRGQPKNKFWNPSIGASVTVPNAE